MLARAFGADVEIVNYEDHAKTTCSGEPVTVEQYAMVLMGPEVYMKIRGYRFTAKSVSDDHENLTRLLKGRDDAEALKANAKRELEGLFIDLPFLTAIEKLTELTELTGNDPECVNPVGRNTLHSLIDPVLLQSESRHVTRLRHRLRQLDH